MIFLHVKFICLIVVVVVLGGNDCVLTIKKLTEKKLCFPPDLSCSAANHAAT